MLEKPTIKKLLSLILENIGDRKRIAPNIKL